MNEKLLKLNYEYLIKYNSKSELQKIAKNLGETNVWYSKINKKLNINNLVDIILKKSNYIILSENEIKELIEKKEFDKKYKYYKTISHRLYSKTTIKNNENYEKPCLIFTGAKDKDGYGLFRVYNKLVRAHRISYALSNKIFVEDIPRYNDDGDILEICHGKDCNSSCIEPSHLLLKTQSENNYEDKIRDGVLFRGIKEKLAKDIKLSKGDGRTQKQRAKDFNVSYDIVNNIDNKKTWIHIPDKDEIINNKDEQKINNRKKRKNILSDDDCEEAMKILKKKMYIDDKTECWIFTGALNKKGYGIIGFKGITFLTHILSYEATYGKRDLSGKNKVIRHLCNNKKCFNPTHLKFGTYKENSIDVVKNKNNKISKLNEKDVIEIKKCLKQKMTQDEIAKKYCVSQSVISNIKNNKTWTHIDFV